MSEKNRALFPLPPTDEPTAYKCIKLDVPLEPPEYRMAFLGAILGLTKWFAWDRDEQKRGILVSQAYKAVFDSAFEQLNDNLQECVSVEFRQNGCDLQFKLNGNWVTIYTLSTACVVEKVQDGYESGGYSPPPQRGTGDSRIIDNATEQKTSLSDLDKVWGACLELHESVFDVCRIICDMLEAAGDALSALGNLVESPVGSVTEWVADDITGTTKNWSTTGSPKWDVGGNVKTFERTITDPMRAITPTKLLNILQRGIDIGVGFLRAALSEDLQEALSSKLFNRLTCLPNGMRKTTGIVLTTEILSLHGQELIDDVDLVTKFVGLSLKADVIIGSIGFLSLLNLPDLFRQYNVGALQPSNSWTVLAEDCPDPNPIWEVTLDFKIAQYGWGLVDGWGNWVSGQGFAGRTKTGATGSPVWAIIRYWSATPFEILEIQTFAIRSVGRVYNFADMQATNSTGLGFAQVQAVNNFVNGWQRVRVVNQTWNGIRLQTTGTASGGTTSIIQQVRIKGRGFNPFA